MISLIINAHNSVAGLVYSWDRNVPSDRLSGRTEVRQDLVLSRREKGWRSREIFQRGLLTEQQSRCEWESTVFYCQQTYLNVNEINPKHCILFYSFYKFYCYAWYNGKMEKRPCLASSGDSTFLHWTINGNSKWKLRCSYWLFFIDQFHH